MIGRCQWSMGVKPVAAEMLEMKIEDKTTVDAGLAVPPFELLPVEPLPAEPVPVEPVPVEPLPVEPVPVDPLVLIV